MVKKPEVESLWLFMKNFVRGEIMICKSCGAVYDDQLLVCPFCQTENVKEAKIRLVSSSK